MFISCLSSAFDALSSSVLLLLLSVSIPRVTSTSPVVHHWNSDQQHLRRAEEYIMTSANIDSLKRSNVCGDGYRIEGALLKSYSHSRNATYPPHEDCSMTFQARRENRQIRIRIIALDINDISSGTDCLDSLRFYQSPYLKWTDKLDSVECGQLTEAENFTIISPTGIVTAHFSTDGGDVSGLGFKVILTAFRHPNQTHPCDSMDEEFLCHTGECISSLLLCDGIAHCSDGSDDIPHRSCQPNSGEPAKKVPRKTDYRELLSKHRHWRGILIVAFLIIIFIAFALLLAYFVCRKWVDPIDSLEINEKIVSTTLIRSSLNGSKKEMIASNNQSHRPRIDDDYNLL